MSRLDMVRRTLLSVAVALATLTGAPAASFAQPAAEPPPSPPAEPPPLEAPAPQPPAPQPPAQPPPEPAPAPEEGPAAVEPAGAPPPATPAPVAHAATSSAPVREAERATPRASAERAGDRARRTEPEADHKRVVGHFGVGWFGISQVPISRALPGGTGEHPIIVVLQPNEVGVPAIGVRYWFTETAGLDAGAGVWVSSGSISSTTLAADKQTTVAFLLHAGVPLSLVTGRHISLQLTPEVNFGYARAEIEPEQQADPPPPAELSGIRIDVGARIGAEIQWGFLDLPELALEGSIGAYLTHQGTDVSVGEAHAAEDDLVFTTAEYQSPWDLFTQHVRARYYF